MAQRLVPAAPPTDEEIERDFERYMAQPLPPQVAHGLPSPVTVDQAFMAELNAHVRRLRWLNEGPDGHDTIDDVVTSTQESRYNYDPYLLWSVSLLNNAPTGGANLLVRFTDTYGRWKQYKLIPGADFSLKEVRGSMGSVFRVVSDTGPAEMIGWVGYRMPFGGA